MQIATLDDFKYKIKNNEIYLLQYKGNLEEIEIPSYFKIDDKQYLVSTLYHECFCYSEVTNVKLNEGIKTLGTNCFLKSKLRHINIPDSVCDIKDYCFKYSNLLNIDFNKADKIGFGVCEDCYDLIEAKLSTNQKVLKSRTFLRCQQLSNLYIPKSITNINSFALGDTPNLINIYIDNDVFKIYYDGVTLYNQNKNELVKVLESYDDIIYEMPDFIKNIQDDAIYNLKVNTILVSKCVDFLNSKGICNCENLVNLYLPNVIKFNEFPINSKIRNVFLNKNAEIASFISDFSKQENIIFLGTKDEYIGSQVNEYAKAQNTQVSYYKDMDELIEQGYDMTAINQIYKGYDKGINLSICDEVIDINILRKLANELDDKSFYYYMWCDICYMKQVCMKDESENVDLLNTLEDLLKDIYHNIENGLDCNLKNDLDTR